MLITVSNALIVENPTLELKNWCKKNLIIINPDYAKKQRMGLWLGDTPKTLTLFEQNGDKWILPFGVLKSLPTSITMKAIFKSDFKEAKKVDFKGQVPLFDYQEKAVSEMINAKYGILQSAAGSGKTQMGIALASRIGKKTLWLCHTLDLIKQSKDRAKLYIDNDLIGTIASGKVDIGKGITFATIQTMSKLNLSQHKDEWDCIITDEVHRVSGSPTSVTQYQKVLSSLSARHKYGLSATVHRSDGMIKATYSLVGEIAYIVPDEEIIGKIMRVGIEAIATGIEITRAALNTDGTLNYAKLINYLCENERRNDLIIGVMCRRDNWQKSSLILSDRISHLETLAKPFKESGVVITGKTKKEDREQALEDMRTGKKRYLFATYSLAKEGLDIPRLERLYMVTPQKDYAVVTQAIGRIARTFEGKGNPICFDFVDNIGYCQKSYKKRCTTYRKNNCYFVQERRTN